MVESKGNVILDSRHSQSECLSLKCTARSIRDRKSAINNRERRSPFSVGKERRRLLYKSQFYKLYNFTKCRILQRPKSSCRFRSKNTKGTFEGRPKTGLRRSLSSIATVSRRKRRRARKASASGRSESPVGCLAFSRMAAAVLPPLSRYRPLFLFHTRIHTFFSLFLSMSLALTHTTHALARRRAWPCV